jgi:hypothetical protein
MASAGGCWRGSRPRRHLPKRPQGSESGKRQAHWLTKAWPGTGTVKVPMPKFQKLSGMLDITSPGELSKRRQFRQMRSCSLGTGTSADDQDSWDPPRRARPRHQPRGRSGHRRTRPVGRSGPAMPGQVGTGGCPGTGALAIGRGIAEGAGTKTLHHRLGQGRDGWRGRLLASPRGSGDAQNDNERQHPQGVHSIRAKLLNRRERSWRRGSPQRFLHGWVQPGQGSPHRRGRPVPCSMSTAAGKRPERCHPRPIPLPPFPLPSKDADPLPPPCPPSASSSTCNPLRSA